uniref:Erythrocyte membrane protein band 4.1-like 4A n=1 Tax=Denticeps clupeoides TaxID=299321 RepID=A0AAY4B660_9TELE
MSCFCPVQEEFYCEVLLLDETKLALTPRQQGIKKSSKGSVVLDYVFSHVNLAETDYFGLRYCDRSHQTYWLDSSKTLAEHKDLITTGPPYTLYFGVKFYAEDPCKLKEEITRYQFFLQVKQDVLQGRLPAPFDISVQLAALVIQSELGDYDPYKHLPGYVSEYRFVPDQKKELEDAVEQIHKSLTGQVPSEAELNYLGIAKALEMYGIDLHPVYGENQSEYFLGLTPVGVVVYKNKTQVGKYFWPRITKVYFKETQFELRVIGKDCSETSFFFKAHSKAACKNMWKCCVEHHTFFRMPENDANSLSRKLSKLGSLGSKHRYSGKTALQMGRDEYTNLPRTDLQVIRTRSKTYPKRPQQAAGEKVPCTLGFSNECFLPSGRLIKNEEPNEKSTAPWEENAPQSGLYNVATERNKSPKFPNARRRTPSGGSENETCPARHTGLWSPFNPSFPARSRSRGNTSSGSESENSSRDKRNKRNWSRQENEMVDSSQQWEAVLRRQKERSQDESNHRRSRHRSRSRSPDVQAKEQLWKHIQYVHMPSPGVNNLYVFWYRTQGDPIRVRHSHSPRSFRQYRQSQCSDGERSVLSEVNSRTDLVPPLPVTRAADVPASSSTLSQDGSEDSVLESKDPEDKNNSKSVKIVHMPRNKTQKKRDQAHEKTNVT